MLLLLLIILIIITRLLIIPMILIINILLFEYGMALSCDCVLTVLNLSAEKWTPTETNSMMDETFELFFSTKRIVLSAEPKKKKQALLFSWWTPAPHPPKEGTLYRWEREKFYICNRGDCFVCTTWFWNLSDFSETRIPSYLPTCSLTMVRFWFWNRTKNSNLQMNVFNSHRGNISALFKIKKRLLGKDLKLSASFPKHCSSTVFYQEFFCFLPPPISHSPGFYFLVFLDSSGSTVVPLCQLDKSQRSIWNYFKYYYLQTSSPSHRHTSVCQTEQQFAQNDPPPLAHCSPSILQSFLRPKYCGSKLILKAPDPAPIFYPPSPLQLLL